MGYWDNPLTETKYRELERSRCNINAGGWTTQMHEAVGATDTVYETEDIKLGTGILKNFSK